MNDFIGFLWRDIKSPAVLHSLLWVTIVVLALPFFNMTVWIRKSHADRFGDKIES